MSENTVTITLSKFVKEYLEKKKGSDSYVEEMIECCLNLLSEAGDFPDRVPSHSFVKWEDDGIVLSPLTFKDLMAKKGIKSRREELYSLLTLLSPLARKRFTRYVEEDLLERMFDVPS